MKLKKTKQIEYIKNKDNYKKRKSEWYQSNKEKVKEYGKKYRKNKTEQIKKTAKIYRDNNREKLRKQAKKVRDTNEIIKLIDNTRRMIRYGFDSNGVKKSCKTINILGCSFEEFKLYLESKFEPWMNWNNYGNPKDGILELNKTWDIDHIIPISKANNEEDVIRLNHYTNLQPLCSYTNRFIKRNLENT